MACPAKNSSPPIAIKPASMDDPIRIIKSIRELSADMMSRLPLQYNDDNWFAMDYLGRTSEEDHDVLYRYPRVEISNSAVFWKCNRSVTIRLTLDNRDPDNLQEAILSKDYLHFGEDEKYDTGEYAYLDMAGCYPLILGLVESFNKVMGRFYAKNAKA